MSQRMIRPLIRAAAIAAPLLAALPAAAQEPKRDLIVTIGGGAQLYPRFPGADKSDLFPMPVVDWRHEGDPVSFEAPDEGIGFGLLGDRSRIDIGPAVQLQKSRRDKDVGAPVGRVGFTVEAGAFIQAWITPNLRVRAEARRGIGGHEAWVGDLGADLVMRGGDSTIFSIGPRLHLSEAKYQRAYFGVSPAAALATGLPIYVPDGGAHGAGVISGINHQFSENWGVRAYAGYDRLIGNASDSPLIRRYGSRNQYSGGLALTYSFRIHRGGGARQ